ncbi:MAG: GGDEF domain-containing protein [Clostridia bacterium]|nr:GGDEF domain-containing protein [Clostridia bacterium]
MNRYYSAIVFITLTMLGTIIVHLFDNETLSRRVKKEFMIIAILIGIGCICEFLGIYLNGTNSELIIIHGIIKAIEFSIAPIIPVLYARIVGIKKIRKKRRLIIFILIVLNIICELISIIKPFVFYIDEDNVYNHAFFYDFYIIMYFAGIVLFVFELLKYTQKYQSRNIATLSAILVFLISGFSLKTCNSDVYTDWLVVAICYLLFMIYYSDLSLKVDPLTTLLNRKSYENRLKKIDYPTAVILLDANNFKDINDNYGHQFGDKILKVISNTIIQAYGKYAHCYRIGGDEFCVILKRGKIEELTQNQKNKYDKYYMLEKLNLHFDELLAQQFEEFPMLKNGVSKGYGIYYGPSDEFKHNYFSSETIKEVIKIADERMYTEKQSRQY